MMYVMYIEGNHIESLGRGVGDGVMGIDPTLSARQDINYIDISVLNSAPPPARPFFYLFIPGSDKIITNCTQDESERGIYKNYPFSQKQPVWGWYLGPAVLPTSCTGSKHEVEIR